MSEPEHPLETLLRTARDVTHERYYIRKDNVYQVPRGVMLRLMKALEEYETSLK